MPRFKKSSSNGDNHFALRAAHIFIFAFIYDITIYDYALRRKTWQVAFSIYYSEVALTLILQNCLYI